MVKFVEKQTWSSTHAFILRPRIACLVWQSLCCCLKWMSWFSFSMFLLPQGAVLFILENWKNVQHLVSNVLFSLLFSPHWFLTSFRGFDSIWGMTVTKKKKERKRSTWANDPFCFSLAKTQFVTKSWIRTGPSFDILTVLKELSNCRQRGTNSTRSFYM